jgi:hypothetical protein
VLHCIRGFSKEFSYIDFNSGGDNFLVFWRIFEFQEPFGHLTDPIFLEDHFSWKNKRKEEEVIMGLHESTTEADHASRFPLRPFVSSFDSKDVS